MTRPEDIAEILCTEDIFRGYPTLNEAAHHLAAYARMRDEHDALRAKLSTTESLLEIANKLIEELIADRATPSLTARLAEVEAERDAALARVSAEQLRVIKAAKGLVDCFGGGWASDEKEIAPFYPPDTDPEDSNRLRDLREAIDTYLGWRDSESEEAGDYLARVVEVGARVKELEPLSARHGHLEKVARCARRLDDAFVGHGAADLFGHLMDLHKALDKLDAVKGDANG